MDCSWPCSSVHGIFQARLLEWVAIPFSRGSTQPRGWTRIFCIARRLLTNWATREATRRLKRKHLFLDGDKTIQIYYFFWSQFEWICSLFLSFHMYKVFSSIYIYFNSGEAVFVLQNLHWWSVKSLHMNPCSQLQNY